MIRYVIVHIDELTDDMIEISLSKTPTYMGNYCLMRISGNPAIFSNFKKFTRAAAKIECDKIENAQLIQEKKDLNNKVYAFSSKKTEDGRGLFLRKHGVKGVVAQNSTTEMMLIAPYPLSKIDEIEIVGCNNGDTVNFKVKDTDAGTYSGYPNAMLNQFGFDVNMCDGMYKDKNPYDSDVYYGLKLIVEYTNNGPEKTIGINYRLHEVK
jgi:hypothetical protein